MINSANIKWLRDRSSSKIIANSLNNYYESSSKIDENKDVKHSENSDHHKRKFLKTRKIESSPIKTDYLFSHSKLQDLKKLRDIFCEFDKDTSSKIIINF